MVSSLQWLVRWRWACSMPVQRRFNAFLFAFFYFNRSCNYSICCIICIFFCSRSLPSENYNADMEDDDEEGCFAEPSWPHLSIVYETLLRVVQSNEIDLSIKKKYIDSRFVVRLLDLFNSQDMREREYLKTITHRIYGKLTNRRALIRRSISNIFFDFIYETEKHAGIAELLEILGSIINGFAVPVKADHVKLLESALIPLHKVKSMQLYHAHLVYCMAQYIEKEQRFAIPIIGGILKFYPYGNTGKELLFLEELCELIEVLSPATLAEVEVPIYTRLAQCIEGDHFQIAEKAVSDQIDVGLWW